MAEVIESNDDGTLKFTGQESSLRQFSRSQNNTDCVKIEGAYLNGPDWCLETTNNWRNILRLSKVSAHSEHWFEYELDFVTHMKVTMAPDGGFSKIRALGYIDDSLII